MKIDLINKPNDPLDTDKLNDLKALTCEKSYEFYKFCVENGVPCAVITPYVGHHHMVLEKGDELINGKIHMNTLGFRKLLGLIDGFVKFLTQDYLAVLPNQTVEGEEWKNQ